VPRGHGDVVPVMKVGDPLADSLHHRGSVTTFPMSACR
jgi:hypothetical protein